MSAKRKPYVPQKHATDKTTPRARAKFLEGLAKGLSATGAAALAGVGRCSVYAWRNADPEFAKAWDDAIEAGTDILEDEALRRALEGNAEPMVSMGKVVRGDDGYPLLVKKHADGLMQFLLKGRRREKFSERVQQDIKLDAKIETDGQQARDIVSERLAQLSERVAKEDGTDKPTLN
jgi:hypothetical protein